MTAKAISFTVRATDQATGPLRGVSSQIEALGRKAADAAAKGAAASARLASTISGVTRLVSAAVPILGGAFLARAGVNEFVRTANAMEKIGVEARTLGVSVRTFASLQYTAEQTNADLGAVVQSLKVAQRELGEERVFGNRGVRAALQRLGVSVRDTQGRFVSMEQLLPRLAGAFAGIEDPMERAAVAQRLFGRGATEVLKVLAEGPERLAAYAENARRLGGIFSPESIEIADRFTDSLANVRVATFGLKARLVEELGPELTEVVNRTASAIAAIPRIVRNAVRLAQDAFGGDGEAQARIMQLFDSAGNLMVSGVRGVFRLLGPAIRAGMDVVLAAIDSPLGAYFSTLPERVALWTSLAYQRGMLALSEATLPEFLVERDRKIFAERTEAIQGELAELDKQMRSMRSSMASDDRAFTTSFLGSDYPEFARIVASVRADVAKTGGEFAKAADEALGWVDALAKTRLIEVPDRPSRTLAPPDTSGFFAGMQEGLDEFMRRAEDYAAQGRQFVEGVTGALTNQLGTALFDAARNFDNLGDVGRRALDGLVTAVGQLAAQMIALRIVSAGIGIFGGGGGGVSDVAFAARAGALKGGIATSSGLGAGFKRFAGGGFVPGPNVNRDIVPAMLAPGEGVLTRAAVRANRPALAYMNAGGVVQPSGGGSFGGSGGGPVVNVAVTVNMGSGGDVGSGGGGGGAESVRVAGVQAASAVADAVLNVLERSAARRDRWRGVLA